MWAVNNHTPYGADRNWTRDKQGRHYWVVAVRATFDVDPQGHVTLADEQPPPTLAPEYAGPPGASSMRWDSDLLYISPCTDVIVEGHAHAPGGRARSTVPVSLRVGPIHKQLQVHGPRAFYQGPAGLAMTSPQPFESWPITYEWAYGGVDAADPDPKKQGMDERNPIGKGFALDTKRLVNTHAPAIQYPGGAIDKVGPAGLGPIDPGWLPRRSLAGTYDATWEKTKKPLLPDDYDPLFGSSAPSDQRAIKHLRGGEVVELLGMIPEGAFRFQLPKIYLTYQTLFGKKSQEHRGKLATVLLLPEQKQVALVWQTTLMVPAKDGDYLDMTHVREKAYLT